MGYMARRFRRETASCTDRRIKLMDEVVAGIRVIKMYAWEFSFKRLVNEARRWGQN